MNRIRLRLKQILIAKRQRFVISVALLSLGFFFSEYFLGKSGFFLTIFLSVLSSILFAVSVYDDLKKNFHPQVFILPFLFTLSFGLFYFLVPGRFLSRTILTLLYGVGLYSLYLSQNIFIVASIRTIGLLNGARIVSFVITLLSYFFLLNVIFTFRLTIVPAVFLVFASSYLLILQAFWTITLDKSLTKTSLWVLALSVCLFEIAAILWFWPSTPTVIALFLTGFFYTIVGISQVWFDKRLFRGVIWEYIWVAVIVFCILILFTSWGGL